MEAITTAISSVIDVVISMLTTITGNAILCALFVGATFVPLGIRTLRKLRR